MQKLSKNFTLARLMEASRTTQNPTEFLDFAKQLVQVDNARALENSQQKNGQIFYINGNPQAGIAEQYSFYSDHPLSRAEHNQLSQQVRDLESYVLQEMAWMQKLENANKLVYSDDVTLLFNSRFLRVALKQECDRYQRFKQPFSILFIDLDNFKKVNDEYGHLVGSSILRQFGVCLRDHVRNVDLVCRYGGDEFVVILLGAVAADARIIAERICEKIAQHDFIIDSSKTIRTTASIGIASLPEHAEDHLSLLKFADKSMYYSKEAGKNQVTVFNPEISREIDYEQDSFSKTPP